MGAINLEKIIFTPLNLAEAEGGIVMHAMKKNDIGYAGFGEAYFSIVSYGSVKAWKKHKKMTMNLIVPSGLVRFVFYSEASDKLLVKEIGAQNYQRITVPPGVWFGFKGISQGLNLVLNVANITHNPKEVERAPRDFIKYDWK